MSRTMVTILFALLSTTACGSGYSSPGAPTPPAPGPTGASTAVSIPVGAAALTTTAFNPDAVELAVGATVTWTNTDVVSHTSTSNNNTWNSGVVAPGGTFSHTFQAAGSFPYHCTIHPGMVGTITVR